MSHNQSYPLPAKPGISLSQHAAWAVREPGSDDTPSLIDLTDGITERLDKAEAITRLLMTDDTALEFLPAAAWAIADLIHEARELYNQQWKRVRSRSN